jgi:hypothetical protein
VDTLRFHAFIKVLEVHDFSSLEESDDDFRPSSNSSEDGDDGYPGHDVGPQLLHPWQRIFRLAGSTDDDSNRLPSLPLHGGGACWPSSRSSSGGVASGARSFPSGQLRLLLSGWGSGGVGQAQLAQ